MEVFDTVDDVAVTPGRARLHEAGWQSWSPAGTYALSERSPRPAARPVLGQRPDCLLARPGFDLRRRWADLIDAFGGLRSASDRIQDLDDLGGQDHPPVAVDRTPAVAVRPTPDGSDAMSTAAAMPRLALYGHSWVVGEAASRPQRRLSNLAAARLGMTPVNLGVGGSSSIETAALVSRHGIVRAEAYLILAGLNDARLHGTDPAALEAYSFSLETVVTACEAAAPDAVVLLVEQPPLLDYRGYPPHDQGSPPAVHAHNRRMALVAERHRRVVVVHVDGWDPATMLDDDTVHPNDVGHATIAAAAVRAYRRAVSMGRTRPVHD